MKQELNHTARDSMVHQITEAMDDLRIKKQSLEVAMDYYEQARSNSYTQPMEEVAIILELVSKRLDIDLKPDLKKAINLSGVAGQIHQGENNGN